MKQFNNLTERAQNAQRNNNVQRAEQLRGQANNLRFVARQRLQNQTENKAEQRQLALQGQYLEILGNIQGQQAGQYQDIAQFNQRQLDEMLNQQSTQNRLLAEIQLAQQQATELETARANRAAVQMSEGVNRQGLFALQTQQQNILRASNQRQLRSTSVVRSGVFL